MTAEGGPDRHVSRRGGDAERAMRIWARALALTAGAVTAGALVAGCGGSSPSGSSASASTASHQQLAIRYSECMRAHGVANFPDPSSAGELRLRVGGPGSINPASPAFAAAQRACAKLSPKGPPGPGGGIPAAAKQQALRFSACMRSHGVAGFPDPNYSASGARLQLSGGINPRSPAFQAAQKACGSPLPGGVVKGGPIAVGPG